MEHMQASLRARSRQEDRSAQSAMTRAPKPGNPILQLQRDFGNRTVQRMAESGIIQTKLNVSRPGDPYEQEADRIAERVADGPDLLSHPLCGPGGTDRRTMSQVGEEGARVAASPLPSFGKAVLQRRCTGCEGGAPCAECEEEEKLVQRKSGCDCGPSRLPASTGLLSNLGPGLPIDPVTRSFMESRFGYDFSQVRIHEGEGAAEAAGAVRALAFTIGRDVVFGRGRYQPQSDAGRLLLAHELTHTVQQRGADHVVQRETAIDPPGSPLEQEADHAAHDVLSGAKPAIAGSVKAFTPQLEVDPGSRETKVYHPPEGGDDIEVVRTLETQRCKREPISVPIADKDVLFFDPNASSFGIRYRFCRGTTQVETESAIRYERLRDQAQELLRNLGAGASGSDVLSQVSEAAKKARLGADTSVVLTISGTLRAEIRASTQQGLPGTSREYEVEGQLRITPRGWSIELGAQYHHIEDELRGTTVDSFQFTPRFEVGPVQVGATVSTTQQRPSAQGPITTVKGSVTLRTGERTGFTLQGSTEGGGTIGISFGTVERIGQVPSFDCAMCVCPPPLPHYTCTKITKAHPGEPVQKAGHETVELHYAYDSTVPADSEDWPPYERQIERISSLVDQNYAVRHILGYASPEASVEYNQKLAKRRAERALGDIRAKTYATLAVRSLITQMSGMPLLTPGAASLPPAEGVGELLGESPTGGEARNRELISVIGARLGALSEDEQLNLLGIDPTTATTAVREDVRRRIEDFRSGKRLTERARWERVFPFLRRVDVTLDRPEVAGPEVPEKRESTNCDSKTLTWAKAPGNFSPLPEEKRLPIKSVGGIGGGCT